MIVIHILGFFHVAMIALLGGLSLPLPPTMTHYQTFDESDWDDEINFAIDGPVKDSDLTTTTTAAPVTIALPTVAAVAAAGKITCWPFLLFPGLFPVQHRERPNLPASVPFRSARFRFVRFVTLTSPGRKKRSAAPEASSIRGMTVFAKRSTHRRQYFDTMAVIIVIFYIIKHRLVSRHLRLL